MSLENQISNFATRAGNECKILHNKVGNLSKLNTTAKDSTVAAINELARRTGSLEDLDLAELIDDTSTASDKVWSSEKTQDEIVKAAQQVKDDLLDGASEAFDTLNELGDLISENKGALEGLTEIAGGAVRYDVAQSDLTADQKAMARTNIGAVALADFNQFKTEIGTTETDFATIFELALNAEDAEGAEE